MAKETIKLNETKDKNKNEFFKFKIKVSDVLFAIAVLTLTFMITTQLSVISKSESVLQNKREAQLAEDLIKLKDQYDKLKKDNNEAEKIIEEYTTNSSTNDKLIGTMKRELTTATALAGLKAMRGEGIIVIVDESTAKPTNDIPLEALTIYNTDLQAIVNELKEAGAEAISINGHRIIANTSIKSVGANIYVNEQRIVSPYTIKVIGNTQNLESAMNIKGGVADSLKKYGIKFNITKEKNILVEKYDGMLSFNYATILE